MSTPELSPEINDLRAVHIDDIITVALHVCLERIWIHAEFHVPVKLSAIKRAVEVLVSVEVGLKAQGFTELWTITHTEQEANFVEHLEFVRTGDTLAGMPVFKKEL